MGSMMTNIIRVDFKKKEKIEKYETFSIKCDVCEGVYKYDSRKDGVKPVLIQTDNLSFCKPCVEAMYDATQ